MSDDGADFGATAEQGMKAVIGGERPEKVMDPVEFEVYIMSQGGPGDYSGTAAYAAKLILLHLRGHPEDARIPVEDEYDPKNNYKPKGIRNLSSVMFAYPEFKQLDLTGFMWGWAVNAARRCCELPSVPNPAIITIGGKP